MLQRKIQNMSNHNHDDIKPEDVSISTVYDGTSYSIYRIQEGEEVMYDIQLFDTVTLHLDSEEWNELVSVMKGLKPEK